VDSLINPDLKAGFDLRRNLEFEPILKYVQFPRLPSVPSDDMKKYEGTEKILRRLRNKTVLDYVGLSDIDKVLKWLQRKEVKTIMELTVYDRLWGSQDERKIAYWLNEFNVLDVHWRCQDLSFAFFTDKMKEQIETIHLYTSGRRAVHEYWFGLDGLRTLKQVWILDSEMFS
jgi:hypothetical protein